MTAIRGPVVAGNWKLNHSPSEARRFFRDFLGRIDQDGRGTLAFFPPAISLAASREAVPSESGILLGVQNIFWESTGAFTGEISAPLANDAGAELVLVGHSERRHIFGESDEETARKTRAALDAGLAIVLCVGERIEEREGGRAQEVVGRQLGAALPAVQNGEVDRLLIAYEPVWAIGTGRTATPDDAAEMHAFVRSRLAERFGGSARAVPILYGGSVKPENASDLLSTPGVDGVLVGGASLEPASFAAIWAARP